MTDLKNKILKGRFHSLRLAMLYALIVGLFFAAVIFLSIRYVSKTVIENVYMSEEHRKSREENYAEKLQSYVKENKLSSKDMNDIAKWAKKNKYLYVMIYKDNQLVFESGTHDEDKDKVDKEEDIDKVPPQTDKNPDQDKDNEKDKNKDKDKDKDKDKVPSYPSPGITIDGPKKEDLIKYAKENGSHLIIMDDTAVFASMADFSEYLYYDISNITAICTAVLFLIIIIMLYFRGVTKRITTLGRDVTIVSNGDMNHVIHMNGNDEISKLSSDVEHMRSSILENVEKERAALDANSQLITSMSHDIRTPLTVLLGYLDVMKFHTDDGVMKDYINASKKTALRLKKLSDDLFNYFLVFGGGLSNIELNEYDAPTLIEQLLFEHVLLLREQGYTVNMELDEEFKNSINSVKIITEAPQFMRIVENLFSNIHKYADISCPVTIKIYMEENFCIMVFSNRIAKDSHDVESNGIGLKTCAKIAEALGAGFDMENSDGEFKVRIKLKTVTYGEPDIKKQKNNEK